MINKNLLTAFFKISTKEQLQKGLEEVIHSLEITSYDPERDVNNLINIISGNILTINEDTIIGTLKYNPTILICDDKKLDQSYPIKIDAFDKIREQIIVSYKVLGNTYPSTSTLDLSYIMQKSKEMERELEI